MATPIYKVFLNKYTAAYYDLPKEEMDNLAAEVDKVSKKLGIKMVVLCESGWDSEEWDFWGVTEFPSLEAVQEFRKWQDGVQWFKYVDATSVLGTKWDV
jgi:hypothetical protein